MSDDDHDRQPAMLSMLAHARLMKLLPKLAAVSDRYRLKVLSDIDRVLAAEGLMWADVAEAMMPPQGEDLPAAELLEIITNIEQPQERSTVTLTENARSFLDQMRERATDDENISDGVHLTFKQSRWLHDLEEQVERDRKYWREVAEREREQAERERLDVKGPVLITMARIEKLKAHSASLTDSDLAFLNDLRERAAAMKKRSVLGTHEEWSRLFDLEDEVGERRKARAPH